jgi:hypothetical protein
VDYSCDAVVGILDWTWWKDSSATTIASYNTLGLFCVEDTLKTKSLLHLFLQVWITWMTEAVAITDVDMIHRIWDEITYGWDICRVTRGIHIEQL